MRFLEGLIFGLIIGGAIIIIIGEVFRKGGPQ